MENHVHRTVPFRPVQGRQAVSVIGYDAVAANLKLDEALDAYSVTHSKALRDEIVADTAWIALRSARHFSHRGEPLDDLVQVARIGLLNAIERFDPSHGVSFGAFATPTIMGELRRHFRDRTWTVYVPRRAKDMRSAVGSATDDLCAELQRAPTSAEIASRLAISVGLVNEVLQANKARYATSLDRAEARDGDEHHNEYDTVLDREVLSALLGLLPTRERTVLELRYFDELSQSQIAQRIGTSQVHVGRLIASSLAALRRYGDQHQRSMN